MPGPDGTPTEAELRAKKASLAGARTLHPGTPGRGSSRLMRDDGLTFEQAVERMFRNATGEERLSDAAIAEWKPILEALGEGWRPAGDLRSAQHDPYRSSDQAHPARPRAPGAGRSARRAGAGPRRAR